MEILKAALLALFSCALLPAAMFPMHQFHVQKLGRLDCNLCHQPVAKGSVELKRPAHAQCKLCHAPEFTPASTKTICFVCHQSDNRKLRAFPPLPGRVLANFSHTRHIDPKTRLDAKTGFRADCLFCHNFAPGALEPSRPSHTQCAACHGKADMPAQLTPFLRAAGCRGCHNPESTEDSNPLPTQTVSAALYSRTPLRFSHVTHLQTKRESSLNCDSCHASIATDQSLATLELPSPAECAACHRVMQPASHTARWRDDLHGKYAALDRVACATCHQTDYCSRCHNELPRSHVPLPLFANGGHARSALLNERACLTCHTFQNTCSKCHARNLH